MTLVATELFVLLIAHAATGNAQVRPQVQAEASLEFVRDNGEWPRLFIRDPLARAILRRGLEDTARLLDVPRCQAVFTRFHDQHGRPLLARLAELGTTPQPYLRWIVFTDAESGAYCDGAFAYTVPGSRVVRVCTRHLETTWRSNPKHAAVTLLHEALHTLGLGENPPPSVVITQRIWNACIGRPRG